MNKLSLTIIVVLMITCSIGVRVRMFHSSTETVSAQNSEPEIGYITFVSDTPSHVELIQSKISQEKQYYANWIVELSANGDKPELVWTVNLWEYYVTKSIPDNPTPTRPRPGKPIFEKTAHQKSISATPLQVWKRLIDQEQYFLEILSSGEIAPNSCVWVNGEGDVANDLIYFGNEEDGEGVGLQCQLENSFYADAIAMGDEIGIPDVLFGDPCDCKGAYGTTIVEPYDPDSYNPLFFYPRPSGTDLGGFAYGVDEQGRSYLSQSQRIDARSEPWEPSLDLNMVVRSEIPSFDTELSSVHELGDECQQHHLLQGQLVNIVPETDTTQCGVVIDTRQTIFYIGHDRDMGTFFHGVLKWLKVDPSCNFAG